MIEDTPVPERVLRAIKDRIIPAMTAWVVADRIDPSGIERLSVQAHENRRDYVFLVHMYDGRTRVFPIEFPVLH